jgi:homocysteine S-methyltransferase
VGPQSTLAILERMSRVTGRPLSAQPNAGLPAQVADRLLYLSSPEYVAEYAARMVAAGARLIGGCCGTTPSHIEAMAARLSTRTAELQTPAPAVVVVEPLTETEPSTEEPPLPLLDALRRGFAISVEMTPPRGANPAKMLAGARLLAEAGVDAVNINDNPMARVRMSNVAAGYLIKAQLGLDPILHLTTRDRNLMALQSELVGAYALGIRAILALTGDPSHKGDYAHAKGVYDVDSIGLIRILVRLNEGVDVAGSAIGRPTNFLIGAALNPTAEDLEWELDRFHQKLAAGAQFVMTQPIYDPDLFASVLARLGPLEVPVLMGVMPLQSYRNAEFVHNELPGVSVPEAVLERMRAAGADGQAEGMAITRELLAACMHLVSGVYVMPTFGRYEQAAELVRQLRARNSAPHAPVAART